MGTFRYTLVIRLLGHLWIKISKNGKIHIFLFRLSIQLVDLFFQSKASRCVNLIALVTFTVSSHLVGRNVVVIKLHSCSIVYNTNNRTDLSRMAPNKAEKVVPAGGIR